MVKVGHFYIGLTGFRDELSKLNNRLVMLEELKRIIGNNYIGLDKESYEEALKDHTLTPPKRAALQLAYQIRNRKYAKGLK